MNNFIFELLSWEQLLILPIFLKAASPVRKESQTVASSHLNGTQKATGLIFF